VSRTAPARQEDFGPVHSVVKSRQHAIRPDGCFGPCPSGAGLSDLRSRLRHLRRLVFHPSVLYASICLRPFAPCPLRHFIATMDALTPDRLSCPVRSPCLTCMAFTTIPSPTTRCSPVVALTHYPSARRASPLLRLFRASPLGGGLAGSIRPNRVRHPTDWSFISCYFPPRLAATQLQLITGRRVYARRGLPPR